MVDLMDSLKDSADDLLSKLDKSGRVRSALDGLRRQMAESEARRLVKTLETEVQGLRSQIDQTTEALGVQTLGLYSDSKLLNTELHPLCKHILDIRTLLDTRQKELEEAQAILAQLLSPTKTAPPITPTPVAPFKTDASGRLCTSCGNPIPPEGDFCSYCGRKVAVLSFCAFCGAELKPDAKFCPQCGKAVP